MLREWQNRLPASRAQTREHLPPVGHRRDAASYPL